MSKKKQQRKTSLIIGLSIIIVLFIVGAVIFATQFTFFSFAKEPTYPCNNARLINWDGVGIDYGVGKTLSDRYFGGDQVKTRGAILPIRINFDNILEDKGVTFGSPCVADLWISQLVGKQQTNIAPELIPAPTKKLTGKIVKGSTYGSMIYKVANVNSDGFSYYYYTDYRCELDEPYPTSSINTPDKNYVYTLEVCFVDEPIMDDDTNKGGEDKLNINFPLIIGGLLAVTLLFMLLIVFIARRKR